jgi:hypothetical protein
VKIAEMQRIKTFAAKPLAEAKARSRDTASLDDDLADDLREMIAREFACKFAFRYGNSPQRRNAGISPR